MIRELGASRMQKTEQARNMRLHIWLPVPVVDFLGHVAEQRNISLSEEIRQALSIHVDTFRNEGNSHDQFEKSIRTHRPSS